jgi:hypothetical protein
MFQTDRFDKMIEQIKGPKIKGVKNCSTLLSPKGGKKKGKNREDEEWLKDFYDIKKRALKMPDPYEEESKPKIMKQKFFTGCGHCTTYIEPLDGRYSSYQGVYK